MLPSPRAAHLQHHIDAQLALAQLATIDKVRAMHEDLEKLYRAQLVAVLLAERLVEPAAGRHEDAPLVATPLDPLRHRPCRSTSPNAMVPAMISR